MKIDFKKIFSSKVAVAILTVAIIVLFYFLNDSYKTSKEITKENAQLKSEYVVIQEREKAANAKVAEYIGEIAKRDGTIIKLKTLSERNQVELAQSQSKAKQLAATIAKIKVVDSSNVAAYVNNCDSLATIVPILSDQIDSAKVYKDQLVHEFEVKDKLKDSVIAKKDAIILSNTAFIDKTMDAYNKSVSKLVFAEKQVKKEKRAKKLAIIGLGVVTTLLIVK